MTDLLLSDELTTKITSSDYNFPIFIEEIRECLRDHGSVILRVEGKPVRLRLVDGKVSIELYE